jgi:hypothetical protein
MLPVPCKLNLLKMSKQEVVAMMDYSILELATGKFNENNMLGQGGFGSVYRACFDRSRVAAVKKLTCCREDVEKEFEVTLKHMNTSFFLIVTLHGILG